MIIGLPKEIKREEYRVGLTPATAAEYIAHGHEVVVESGAGLGSGFSDDEYWQVGCRMADSAKDVFAQAGMIVKVKEPLPEEYGLLREGQILFTYLHLAANRPLTELLLTRKVTGIAYETVMERDGSLPLLVPMSQIAGRMAVQEGAKYLEKTYGGRGILLSGVPGIQKGKVLIIGAGIAGTNACRIASGMGAEVTIMDINPRRLAELEDIFGHAVNTLYSNRHNLDLMLPQADLVIGAVLIPGAAAPKLIRREDLARMKPGAVIVDIAIDQGGCAETSRPTYHSDPVFIVDDVVHYCVANIPGAVGLSSTSALTSVTNRYGLTVADEGVKQAMRNSAIAEGINTYRGLLTNAAVAAAHDMACSTL